MVGSKITFSPRWSLVFVLEIVGEHLLLLHKSEIHLVGSSDRNVVYMSVTHTKENNMVFK